MNNHYIYNSVGEYPFLNSCGFRPMISAARVPLSTILIAAARPFFEIGACRRRANRKHVLALVTAAGQSVDVTSCAKEAVTHPWWHALMRARSDCASQRKLRFGPPAFGHGP